MSQAAAIRCVASAPGRGPKKAGAASKAIMSIQLLCHVKPGVSSGREGITAVTESQIELCVAAQAKEGEANAAVRDLIAQVLGLARSRVEIAKGHKSRDKTILLHDVDVGEDAPKYIQELQQALEAAVER